MITKEEFEEMEVKQSAMYRLGVENGEIKALADLSLEILKHRYDTVSQIMGAISNRIGDIVNNENMTSEIYEAEAKADHFSDNQYEQVWVNKKYSYGNE